jgi:hypothetical protein
MCLAAGTDEIRPAQIFVAETGASNYTYAEATLTQSGVRLGSSRSSPLRAADRKADQARHSPFNL